jgi:hypothetical protein
VCVVGSVPELGSWRPERAVRLEPAEGEPGVFSATLTLATLSSHPAEPPQYKYIIRDARGAGRWEHGSNRDIPLPTRMHEGDGSPQDVVLRDVVRAEGAGVEWPVEPCDMGEASTAVDEEKQEEVVVVNEEELQRQQHGVEEEEQLDDEQKNAAGPQADRAVNDGGPLNTVQETPDFRGHDRDTQKVGDCSTKAAASLSRNGAAHEILADEAMNHSQSAEAPAKDPADSMQSAGEGHDSGNSETSNIPPKNDSEPAPRTIMVTFSRPSNTAPREPPVYLVDRLKKTLFGSE